MSAFHRLRLREVHWLPLLLALLLTATGVAFVVSATYDPAMRLGLGREARLQLAWWVVGLGGCALCAHVSLLSWKRLAMPAYLGTWGIFLVMALLAGTALVPSIKGQHNWLALGPLRVQPSEFCKLAVLLAAALVATRPGFDARRLPHSLGLLALVLAPAAMLAREDLGSAMTFFPMVLAMLVYVGMRGSHLLLLAVLAVGVLAVGIANLPKEGPKAYKYHRVQAFLHPEEYQLTEGYQTSRSIRSIGSGQVTGKGYAAGDLNRLGWLPEKHTDMIFAVVGEEIGFIGSAAVVLGFLAFGLAGLHAATQSRDPFGRVLGVGVVSLIIGQMTINLAVALGLMPVTGITLPFFSYGGSSLLATYLGVGLLLSTGAGTR
jgi:cell division protein FtsW (lipid II flippase)